jgi:hypothetical protein
MASRGAITWTDSTSRYIGSSRADDRPTDPQPAEHWELCLRGGRGQGVRLRGPDAKRNSPATTKATKKVSLRPPSSSFGCVLCEHVRVWLRERVWLVVDDAGALSLISLIYTGARHIISFFSTLSSASARPQAPRLPGVKRHFGTNT